MNKIKLIMLTVLIGLLGTTLAYAVTTANVSVNAEVPNEAPDMTLVIKELSTPGQDPWSGTDVTAMNFGTLTSALTSGGSAGLWYSPKYYCVFIFTTSFGKRYQVTSTSTGLTSGATSLPAGSFGVTPQYIAEDAWTFPGGSLAQGAQPVGSTLGTAGSAVATNKIIYTSEPAASNRIIRAFYSLPPYQADGSVPFPGFTPIPLSQASGTYTGTATLTIAAI